MAKKPLFDSYVALGDSFTEGLGDALPNGSLRGWADRVAEGICYNRVRAGLTPVTYANLAIRGRKVLPVIEEQVPPAIEMGADLVSFNAGGNDILRPGFDPHPKLDRIFGAVQQMVDAGSHVLLLSGPNAGHNLPLGGVFSARGAVYTEITAARAAELENVTFVDNFSDEGFINSGYWSEDGLHLSTAGHLRVAANILDAFNLDYPTWWRDPREEPEDDKSFTSLSYARDYVAPWVGRRLTGRSSGDGRSAKRPRLTPWTCSPDSRGDITWWEAPKGGRH